jgi:hypothetical protein
MPDGKGKRRVRMRWPPHEAVIEADRGHEGFHLVEPVVATTQYFEV